MLNNYLVCEETIFGELQRLMPKFWQEDLTDLHMFIFLQWIIIFGQGWRLARQKKKTMCDVCHIPLMFKSIFESKIIAKLRWTKEHLPLCMHPTLIYNAMELRFQN